ncbi:MAG: sialidase-1 [Verrucomicrobiales bacterium]
MVVAVGFAKVLAMKSWNLVFLSAISLALLNSCVTGRIASPRFVLEPAVREQCVKILNSGLKGDEFWPSIHAAEGLTIGGHGAEVQAYLEPKLSSVKDDQQRCGIARELVRAGDRSKAQVMLDILAGDDPHGHTHAAESLYKVNIIGDGVWMRRRFEESDNITLRLMAAAALAKKGNRKAMRFLRESMTSDDEGTYRIAAWILGRIGGKRDAELLRARLGESDDPVVDAYLNNSLAALGDPAGLAALKANLSSSDPALRTYAATFAGDARAIWLAPHLQQLLSDPHPDARYRAAQSLLDLER